MLEMICKEEKSPCGKLHQKQEEQQSHYIFIKVYLELTQQEIQNRTAMQFKMKRTFLRNLDSRFPNTRQFGARYALIILFTINLLNYTDRYVPAAVKQLIQKDLNLTDFETSLPTAGMIICYIIFAIIFGVISDRSLMDRRVLLCGAIVFWSISTALAGLATSLTQLVALRSLIGVGEAAYGIYLLSIYDIFNGF